MIKRTICISSPCKLTYKNCQMCVEFKESGDSKTVPVEDIGVVLIENQQVIMTIPLMNALVHNNVSVVICDSKMMPNSMLCGLSVNSVQAEVWDLQSGASAPVKKNAWKQIVESKIRNQSAVLSRAEKDGEILKPYYSNVLSGDSDNREAVSARVYWHTLFDIGFTRDHDGDGINSLLNYGYAILRAAVARAAVGSGLSCQFGIHHCSRYDAFPLADDLMEPYRPFVDMAVYKLFCDGVNELNTAAKKELLSILTADVHIGDSNRPLQLALSSTTASYVKYLKGDIRRVVLPDII